jgi:uncharacterized membrane protein
MLYPMKSPTAIKAVVEDAVVMEPAEKAAAARLAMLISRTNTMLSIPMLYMMSAQSHGGL